MYCKHNKSDVLKSRFFFVNTRQYQRLKDSELVIPNETSWMHRTCRCKTKGIENETEKQEYSNKQKSEFPKSIHIKQILLCRIKSILLHKVRVQLQLAFFRFCGTSFKERVVVIKKP